MAKIDTVSIQNYRSIEELEIQLPQDEPLILIGENNAGKSNIVRGIQLTLGPFWPSNHEPEEHEFFRREPDRVIQIDIGFAGGHLLGGRFRKLRWRYDKSNDPPVFYQGEDADGNFRFVRTADRDTCACVVIDADRNLSYQLSYTSKWTFLSRLMHRFHRELQESEEIREKLEGLFADVKAQFHELPSFSDFVSNLQKGMEDLVSSMTHSLEVDFEAYNPVNFFHALRLQASENGLARTLEEMGTGEQQVLAMAFAHAYAKAFHEGILLTIEEPEAHLHPLAQEWLARRLKRFDFAALQMIITTHSPAFIDLLNLEGLVLVRKEESTYTTQLTPALLVDHCIKAGTNAHRTKTDTILPYYAASATREILEAFFAKIVVLVEGPTETLALPILFRRAGINTLKRGIAFVPVGGKGNLARWKRLFDAYNIPCYVIFDNDAEDDEAQKKRKDILAATGVADDMESYLDADDLLIDEEFAIFGDDFESGLEELFAEYIELLAEARKQGIEGKPLTARFIAERLSRDAAGNADGWTAIEKLAKTVADLDNE